MLVGCYYRCPIVIEEGDKDHPRFYVLAQLDEYNEIADAIKVKMHDLLGSRQYYEEIFQHNVFFGNRQISRRIKKHLWLSNRSWARDVHSFGILHSWGALAGKSCSAQASSIWLIAGAFRRTQSK